MRQDGSVSWIGEVKDTGERAVLMLWGNALLTGYFAYKGTIFGVENLEVAGCTRLRSWAGTSSYQTILSRRRASLAIAPRHLFQDP